MTKKPGVKVDCFFVRIRKPKTRSTEDNGNDADYMQFGEIESARPNDLGKYDTYKFAGIFERYVNSFQNKFHVQESNGHALNLDTGSLNFNSKAAIISGRLKGGTSGVGKNITAKDNAEESEFVVTTAHVDSMDFYFLIWLPPDRSMGLLLIQGLSIFSIAYTMVLHLKQFLRREYNLIAEFNKFIPKEYAQKVQEESVIEEIVLTKHKLPPDSSLNLTGFDFIEDGEITIELRVKRLRDFSDMIKQKLNNRSEDNFLFASMPILEQLGMDSASTERSIKYDRNGKKATAKSSNNYDFSPYYYAEEEDIEYNESTNLPTQESAESFILEVLEIVQEDLRSAGI